jgi:hypothetical protein
MNDSVKGAPAESTGLSKRGIVRTPGSALLGSERDRSYIVGALK